jgi:hypothetical protein
MRTVQHKHHDTPTRIAATSKRHDEKTGRKAQHNNTHMKGKLNTHANARKITHAATQSLPLPGSARACLFLWARSTWRLSSADGWMTQSNHFVIVRPSWLCVCGLRVCACVCVCVCVCVCGAPVQIGVVLLALALLAGSLGRHFLPILRLTDPPVVFFFSVICVRPWPATIVPSLCFHQMVTCFK